MKRALTLLAVTMVAANSVGCGCCRNVREYLCQGGCCGAWTAPATTYAVAPVVAPAPVYAPAPMIAPAPICAPAPVCAPAPMVAAPQQYVAPQYAAPQFAAPQQYMAPQYAVAAPAPMMYSGESSCCGSAAYMAEPSCCSSSYMAEPSCAGSMGVPATQMYATPSPAAD